MYSLEGASHAPPLRKRPQRIAIGLKCMFIAQFFKASSLKKKIRSITFIVWVLGRVEKNAYTHFSRAFQKYSFYDL